MTCPPPLSDVNLIKGKLGQKASIDCLILMEFTCIDPDPHENLLLSEFVWQRYLFWQLHKSKSQLILENKCFGLVILKLIAFIAALGSASINSFIRVLRLKRVLL